VDGIHTIHAGMPNDLVRRLFGPFLWGDVHERINKDISYCPDDVKLSPSTAFIPIVFLGCSKRQGLHGPALGKGKRQNISGRRYAT